MKEKIEELLNNCHEKKKMIIKQIKDNVATIVKLPVASSLGAREYLSISYEIGTKTRTWNLPSIEKGTKYKGLELFKAYTKEDLDL